MNIRIYFLSFSLVIYFSGCLRRMIPLREEHKEHQSKYIRNHHKEIRIERRKTGLQAELVAARSREAKENAYEERRFDIPVSEDHRCNSEIAISEIDTRREHGKNGIRKTHSADSRKTS